LNLTPEKHSVDFNDVTDGMSQSGFVKPEETGIGEKLIFTELMCF
jgi:hypothetical protein